MSENAQNAQPKQGSANAPTANKSLPVDQPATNSGENETIPVSASGSDHSKSDQLVAILPNALFPYLPGDHSMDYYGLRTPICYYTERGEEVIYDPHYPVNMVSDGQYSNDQFVQYSLDSSNWNGQAGGAAASSSASENWAPQGEGKGRIFNNRGGRGGRRGGRGFRNNTRPFGQNNRRGSVQAGGGYVTQSATCMDHTNGVDPNIVWSQAHSVANSSGDGLTHGHPSLIYSGAFSTESVAEISEFIPAGTVV